MARATAAAIGLGFRVHTGWATAVALRLEAGEPQVFLRRRVELWNPEVPETRAPWHAALELEGKAALEVTSRASKAAHQSTRRAVRALVRELGGVGAIGVVIASDPDLSKIGSAHVRAHAAEGLLYREALERAATACKLPCTTVVQRDLHARAASVLRRRAATLAKLATELGAPVGRPWRAEEKSAALVAWLGLREAAS